MAHAQNVQDEPAGPPVVAAVRPVAPDRWAVAGIYLLAALPLALAVGQAVGAPRLHVLPGYWHVLAKITRDDGSLIPGQVWSYHLDQPFAVPSLLFWADARFFGGDNRMLTLFAVVAVAVIVTVLRLMLPAGLGSVRKAALTTGFAFIMLSSHAAEVWLQGTNGMSWTPALLFSVLALFAIHCGRFWPAIAAAAAGSLSFGAAFPIWLALALVVWLRREQVWKSVVLLAVGVGVFAVWLVTRPAEQHSLASSALDPGGQLSVAAAALGGLWTSGGADIAVTAGGSLAAGLLLFGWTNVRRRTSLGELTASDRDEAAWVGLACYAMAVAVLLAMGRTSAAAPGGNAGLISRYVLVAGLATSAALVLLTVRRPSWPAERIVALALAVGLITHAVGTAKLNAVRDSYTPLGLVAVAMKVNATGALTALRVQPGVIPAAKALGTYPFTDDFTLGCGGRELGDVVDLRLVKPLPDPETGGSTKGVIDTGAVTGDAVLSGWAVVDGRRADCVLVVDTFGWIVGGGVTGLLRPDVAAGGDTTTGWHAVAAPDAASPAIVIVAGATLYWIEATS